MKKNEFFFDIENIKINKEYYEKLKTIDYSKVEYELYGMLIPYYDYLISDITIKDNNENIAKLLINNPEEDENISDLRKNNPKEFEKIMTEYREKLESYGYQEIDEIDENYHQYYEEYEKEFKEEINEILEKDIFPYPDMELITIIGAYILLILQESTKKFDLPLILENSNLPNEVQEIILLYISDSIFEMQLFSLINKFQKDELLAFIVFSFDFNHHLKYLTKESEYNNFYPLSEGFLKLFLNILNIKDNDEVLNLYSNLGQFLIESSLYNPNISIYASEDYYLNEKISILKTILFSNNIKFENTDKRSGITFNNTNIENFTTLEYFVNRLTQQVDKIFLNLSLISKHYKKNREEITVNFRNRIENNFKFQNNLIKDTSLEWLFHILLINQLKDNGKAISLVETNILFNPENRDIRKFFIENGYIEAIIYLPTNIIADFSVPLALIVFSRENKKIKFIDAYNLGEIEKFKKQDINIITDKEIDRIINLLNNENIDEIYLSKKVEDFIENNYNLLVTENIEILLEFKGGTKFGDIIKTITRGSQIKANKLEKIKTTQKTSNIYLSISNVNDGLIEFENIKEYLTEIPANQEKFCVKNNSILLSKYGNLPYKFAVAQIPYDDKEKINKLNVIASGNFIIIEVDEKKIDPWYLGALFSSPLGSKILKKAYSESDNLTTLSISKLKEILIQFPSMKKQKKIAQEYREAIKKIEEMKKDLKNCIQKTKQIFIKNDGGLI